MDKILNVSKMIASYIDENGNKVSLDMTPARGKKNRTIVDEFEFNINGDIENAEQLEENSNIINGEIKITG